MKLLDTAMCAELDRLVPNDDLSYAQAAFVVARTNAAYIDEEIRESSDDNPGDLIRLDNVRRIDEDTKEAFKVLLGYREGKPGAWLQPNFVKPAIASLAILFDRLQTPTNRSAFRARMARKPSASSAYGLALTAFSIELPEDTKRSSEKAEIYSRAVSALACAAHWALLSHTAQKLGVAFAQSVMARADEEDIAARYSDGQLPFEVTIGPDPYITLEEVL